MHVISFLLQMGFREVGVAFPLANLNPLQANIAAHLSQLGLLAPFRLLLHCNLTSMQGCLCAAGLTGIAPALSQLALP